MRIALSVSLAFFVVLAVSAKGEAEAILARASWAMSNGNFDLGERLSRQVVAIRPDFAEAWVALGFCLYRQDRQDEAGAAFEEALGTHRARFEEDPDNANELFQQVFLLVLLDREEESLELLRKGRKQFPQHPSFQLSESGVMQLKKVLSDPE